MIQLYIATEDALSEAVADRLVAEVNHGLQVAVRIGRGGNSYLKNKFPELTRLARSIPVLLLTDLDNTDCAPILLGAWSQGCVVPEGMLFRVVVREIEAWLMADRKGFADFFQVPKFKIPEYPETIDDPKQFLLHLIRRYSNREIKAAILPERGSKARIGLGYNQMLSRFVAEGWEIRRAAATSDSLARAFRRLTELSAQAQAY
ncbi:MAG: hypothetical protein A2521_01890 [Deltaproteobacteria bacterium RIFOXYD12_FULL_57_12]|nr:MAG: hypothetical protein A2521_01890 [Deltaproteobacteria bacterium RIFOXYD12_FULL_57_12]